MPSGCRASSPLGPDSSDLIAWGLSGNGNFLGKWESDWFSRGPTLGRASSLAARLDCACRGEPERAPLNFLITRDTIPAADEGFLSSFQGAIFSDAMVNLRVVAKLTSAGMLLAAASPVWPVSSQAMQGGPAAPPVVSTAGVPPGTEALRVEWVRLPVPRLGVLLAAVARPTGAGPFPVVVLLHGSHGFAHEYVRLAQDLAGGGVLAVAACWFQGAAGSGASFITPIGCPEAPPMPGASSPQAIQTLEALMQAARTLPGARPDRVGLFGHSRGGALVLTYILRAGDVQAAVLNSAGYPSNLSTDVKAPVLMLHGTADSLADGGVAVTNVQMARDFEAKLRTSGKPVEAVYYEGGRHNDIFSSPTQYRDEVQRILVFLLHHLRN
jgi:carboxymethylenebutenolidase